MKRKHKKGKLILVIFIVLSQTLLGPVAFLLSPVALAEEGTVVSTVSDETKADSKQDDSASDRKNNSEEKEEAEKKKEDTQLMKVTSIEENSNSPESEDNSDKASSKTEETKEDSAEKEAPTGGDSDPKDSLPKEETPLENEINNPAEENDSTNPVPEETPVDNPVTPTDQNPTETVVEPLVTPEPLDVTPPTLTEKTAVESVIHEDKASYTFTSSEAGKVSYQGSCQGDSDEASSGDNKINFSNLTWGVHDECSLIVTDEAGNKSEPLKVSSFTYEETNLEVTVNPTKTSEVSPTLSGRVSDSSAKVEVSVAGQSYTADNNNGNWTLPAETIDPPLSVGTYDVKAMVTDPNNLVVQDSTVNELVVSATAAAATTLWITVDPLLVSSSTPVLSGKVSDPTATITITVGGNSYSASGSGGVWMVIASSPLADGVYNVVATATLPGGITATDGTTNELTIDTVAPVVTVNTLITTNHYPEISGTIDDLNATLEISLNNGRTYYTVVKRPNHTWYLPVGTLPYINIGTYDVKARAIDRALNYGYDTTTNELQIVFTLPAPIISQVVPVLTPTNNPTPSYTFHSDQVGVITYGGSCSSTNTNAVVGNNTITFNSLAEGIYTNCTVTVTNNGVSSNVLTVSPFTIDLTAPIVTVNNINSNNSQPNLTGTIDDPKATIDITINGVTNTALNNGDGTWSLNWPTVLADGTYNIIATATDLAGNVGTDNTTNELTITTPVVITSVVVSPASVVLLSSQTQQFTAQAYDGGNNPVSATFTWSVDNAAVGTIDTNGLFTAIGAGTATVTANSNGVLGTATLTVDTLPVVTEVTPVPTPTNNTTPSYTFNSDQAGTITYGGACSGLVTIAMAGDNTIVFDILAEGTYNNCTITVTNNNGFSSNILAVSPFTIDLTAPVVTVDTLLTNTSLPTLTGTIDDSTATIDITINGITNTATNNGDGTWSLSWPVALTDGTYEVVARATDPAGNVGIDNTINELTINSGAGVITTIMITPTSATLNVNDTQQFTAQAYDGNGVPLTTAFNWSVDNVAVGTIDSNGLFTAVGAGDVTVTAESSGITATATVTVSSVQPPTDHEEDEDEDNRDNTDPDIDHDPVRHALVGENIKIKAEVKDDESGVDEVKIYYRISGQSHFTSHEMHYKGDHEYSYTIPAVIDPSDEIEYYLRATDEEENDNREPNQGYWTIDIFPSEHFSDINQVQSNSEDSEEDNSNREESLIPTTSANTDTDSAVKGAQDTHLDSSANQPAGNNLWWWLMGLLAFGGILFSRHWWKKKGI